MHAHLEDSQSSAGRSINEGASSRIPPSAIATSPLPREIGKRLDALVERTVPGVRTGVKWNSPFYGVEGKGWFLSFHVFTRYVKVTFFNGASLKPLPPGASKSKDVRYLDIHEDDDIDEKQMKAWLKQAAAVPGWIP